YFNDFAREEFPYANDCIGTLTRDDHGRLWVNTCGQHRLVNSLGLFRFDGYQYQPVDLYLPNGEVLAIPSIKGRSERGHLFGLASGGNRLFLLNPRTLEIELRPPLADTQSDLMWRGVTEWQGRLFALAAPDTAESPLQLYREKAEGMDLILEVDYPARLWSYTGDHPIRVTEEAIWLMGAGWPLYRYSRRDSSLREYGPAAFGLGSLPPKLSRADIKGAVPRLLIGPDGRLYFCMPAPYGLGFFRYDQARDQFVPLDADFPVGWSAQDLFQDERGQLLFLFRDEARQYRAALLDSLGRYHDFSAVLAEQQDIVSLSSQDFRREILVSSWLGLVNIGVRSRETIQQILPGEWVSAMEQLSEERLLVNTVDNGWWVWDESTQSAQRFTGPSCGDDNIPFGKGMKQQIIPDATGGLWMISHAWLVRYDPAADTCVCYPMQQKGRLFSLLDVERVLIQTSRQTIGLYDLRSRQFIELPPGIPADLGDMLRDIYVDRQGLIWIPTNNGLWRLDLEQGESRRLDQRDGFADFRFTAIHEDDRGLLWLGTFYGGLHIYDPETGQVRLIDERQGLSNNAVMGIIADASGEVWVTTQSGINIFSPAGELLTTLYQEDGLSTNKFERFDPYRSPDGRLFFGSRDGISLVWPDQLKASLRSGTNHQIYLTELSFNDYETREDRVWRHDFHRYEPLHIPPEQPYLHLRFALSNYLEPGRNRYAYLLEGKSRDWQYLGRQPELTINRLPPGKYRLLLRGADFRNNWTREPLVIPLHVHDFFYKQAWFYLLLSLPLGIFAYFWVRNKQLEARRLETEVARRTEEIRQDKAVIEAQARQLQQLDELKSRFFTNISHELRTPVTLITAPLENLIKKSGHSLEATVRRSLRMVLANGQKLRKLVEELLELSRLDARRTNLRESPTPVVVLVRRLVSAYESGAAIRKIALTFTTDLSTEGYYLLDPRHLEKIVNNLLSNALKFTPEGGRIELSLRQEAAALLVEVSDTGRGIAPEDLPHVFDRYFQTKREGAELEGGTGIGLALSRELSVLMNGELSVESEWGKGTRFTLRLPARPAEAKANETERSAVPGISAGEEPVAERAAARLAARVLIVE
ncbi:MAG: hypothetical protein KDC54_07540, partial [Lewinella sp.]|nr:hypothetical protein [Lewinella sp.]